MAKKLISLFLISLFVFFALPVSANIEENLVKGLSYTIKTGEPVTMSYSNYVEDGTQFDVDNGQLTDTKTATNSASADGWYRAFRAQSRIVTFDLGAACAVSSIEAGFLHYKAAGIYAPRYINISLSDDGSEFGTVKEYQTEYDLTDLDVKRCEFKVTLDKPYAARYVRVEFSSDIFTFCDEIRVLGNKALSGSEEKAKPDKQEQDRGYLKSLDGVSNIIKLYNGYYKPDQEKATLTEDKLLPYIAYLDTNGNIAGTMFDAVAIVPCHGDYPSGGRLVKTNNKPGAIMSDWLLYFDYTFKAGQDLDALNKVVGRVYSELGLKGKYKVFLTLPYPTVIDKPFGDIDGDGTAENCQTLEERLNIIKWFADKCIERFKENKYESLELAGFYWLREEVNYSDSDHEAELVTGMNKYADKKNLDVIFDPFYLSIGYDHWEALGFDGAVMQPNLAFDNTSYFKTEMLDEFAQTINNKYLGVEMETNEPSYFKGEDYLVAGKNYESYLFYGAKTGYMNSLKTYYQGAGPGSFYDFCYADINTPKGVYLRRLYDLTYAFIHKTYKNLPPQLAVNDIELVAGDTRAMAEISITDSDSFWGDVQVEFPNPPEHGSVAAAATKKTLIYRAEDGFVGNDSFTVRITDGFNYSEELTVNVTVNPLDVSQNSNNDSLDISDSGSDLSDKGMPVWLIIVLSVLGVAVISVAVFTVLKKNKKAE